MKFCKRCGSPVESDDIFCGECGMPLSRTAPEAASDNAAPAPQPPMDEEEKNTPRQVILAQGEEIVREYRCCASEFPNQEGILTVTTHRVIFQCLGEKALLVQELPLENVAGIKVHSGTVILWGRTLGGFAAAAAGLSVLFTGMGTAATAMLFLAGMVPGAILMYLGLRSRFVLEITSSGGAAIQVGRAGRDLLLHPAEEDERLATELGALICDLKNGQESAARPTEAVR